MIRLSTASRFAVLSLALAAAPAAAQNQPQAQATAAAPGASAAARGRTIALGACRGLPSHAALKAALEAATQAETSGLNNQMWATIVNRDGIVCAVAFSGVD